MRGQFIRRSSACAFVAMAMAFSAPAAFAQSLPETAVKAGFRTASGKRVAEFQTASLSGTRIGASAFAGAPALFHVFSVSTDVSGEGLALAAALRQANLGLEVYALSLEAPKRIAAAVARSGLDPAFAAAEAKAAIRALGSPAAPAWIFVAPGGGIVAFRLGSLDAGQGLEAVRALAAAYQPRRDAAVQPAPPGPPAASGSRPVPGPAVALNVGVADSSFAQAIELEVAAELNLARTQPGRYAELLREYRGFIRGLYLERPGEVTVVLNEGAKAVDEAIAFLERQKPLAQMSLSKGLSQAARDHARDQGQTGQTGHGGSDRSTMDKRMERYGTWGKTIGENIAYGAVTARDIVIQLLVDDGVPSRGHRTNIFNPEFLVVGIAFGVHPGYRAVCVQDFAGEFVER